MMTKDDILKRAASRKRLLSVNQVDLSAQGDNTLTPSLSPIEAWELLAKISREMYYLQTGKITDSRVDKSIVNILQR
jgi:hypothetical protein